MINETQKRITYKIIEITSEYYKIDIKNKYILNSRKRKFVIPRQVTMYLIYKYTKLNLKETGDFFKKDHATVLHARKTIKNLTLYDKELRTNIQNIETLISAKIDFKKSFKETLIFNIVNLLNEMEIEKLTELNLSLIK